jgi:RNA-binding protein
MPLTGKQKRHLRALAHHLSPVVQVGVGGVSDPVVAKTVRELERHELIKVKVSGDAPEDTRETGEALARACGAELAQTIGRTCVLYRRRKKDPRITLPSAEGG